VKTHRADPRFWECHKSLSSDVRKLADASFELLKADERHPSLHFKKVGRFYSVRVGLHYRAIAVGEADLLVWFWIGHHSEYDRLLGRS
jgi:hypothetical protein